MSDNVTPISIVPIDADKLNACLEAAEALRDIADQMEAGEISEIVIVYNDIAKRCFASFGQFEDRWRLLGALEYAKQSVPLD